MENYIVLTAGVWLVFSSLFVDTSDAKSTMFFKIIPFFLGSAISIVAIKALAWI